MPVTTRWNQAITIRRRYLLWRRPSACPQDRRRKRTGLDRCFLGKWGPADGGGRRCSGAVSAKNPPSSGRVSCRTLADLNKTVRAKISFYRDFFKLSAFRALGVPYTCCKFQGYTCFLTEVATFLSRFSHVEFFSLRIIVLEINSCAF